MSLEDQSSLLVTHDIKLTQFEIIGNDRCKNIARWESDEFDWYHEGPSDIHIRNGIGHE